MAATEQGSFWRRNRVGLIAGAVLIGAALVAAVVTSLSGLTGNAGDGSGQGDRASVFAVCQDEMRSRLKVPQEAVFGRIEDAQIKRDGATWTLLSEVDAADGTGGTVHSTYRCTAVHVEGTTYQVKTTLLG